MENHKSSTSYFREPDSKGDLKRILIFSLVFHVFIFVLAGCALLIKPTKKPHEVPIVELVNPPRPKPKTVKPPKPLPKPEPEPEPEIEEPVEELPPEIKPEKKKPKKKVKKKPKKKAVPKPKKPAPVEPPKDSVVEVEDDWGEEEIVERSFEPTANEKVKINSYRGRILAKLKRRFNPIEGQKEHYGKSCTVSFKVYRNGAVLDVQMTQSSGVDFIDAAALRALKKGRLEKLPDEFSGQYMGLMAELIYTLD